MDNLLSSLLCQVWWPSPAGLLAISSSPLAFTAPEQYLVALHEGVVQVSGPILAGKALLRRTGIETRGFILDPVVLKQSLNRNIEKWTLSRA